MASRILTAVVGLALAAGTASAQVPRRSRRPKPAPTSPPPAPTPAPKGEPTPGTCEAIGESVKRCYLAGLSGEFEVKIARPSPVFVSLDEPLLTAVAPDARFIAYERTKGTTQYVVYQLLSEDLPTDTTSILRTASSTITLRFVAVSRGADTQVHIVHSDRAKKDAEVERRVAERTRDLEARYQQRLDDLDLEAERRARHQLAAQLVAGDGMSLASLDVTPSRNNMVVLRAHRFLRAGAWRFVEISVDNRDRPALAIGQVLAWQERGGSRVQLDAEVHCARPVVGAGKRERCIVALGLSDELAAGTVRLRLHEKNGSRTVELRGLDVR